MITIACPLGARCKMEKCCFFMFAFATLPRLPCMWQLVLKQRRLVHLEYKSRFEHSLRIPCHGRHAQTLISVFNIFIFPLYQPPHSELKLKQTSRAGYL